MADRLYFTDSDEANALIASDPLALLVGFVPLWLRDEGQGSA